MKDDILTVMWKERKGLFRAHGRRGQVLMSLLSPILLAIVFPLQEGKGWVGSALSLLVAFIVPLLLVGITVPDSFAGERERHTLPTLLASRLPDRAILFGKIATAVALGWGVTLFILLLSLLVVNVVHWDGHLLLYKPSILLANLSISLLVSLLTAGVGILFSLRSATVQQAQQATMAVMLLPAMVLQFGLMFVLESPSAKASLESTLGALSFGQLMLVIVSVLAVAVAGLLLAAMARFERSRLILG